MNRESRRYLGMELAGAKNQKTALAVLEYYSKENKIFLLDIHDRVPCDDVHPDEALLDLIRGLAPGVAKMGVNVPLELPPCLNCAKKSCKPGGKCTTPAVKWMRELTRKAARQQHLKVLEFTPYTQRPVELWVRYHVLPRLHAYERFEIDEALGGNKAPLTARMHFMKRHLGHLKLVEAWPKLTVAVLAGQLQLSKRTVSSYRRLEEGVHAREDILEALAKHHDIFIYERDIRKLASNLSAFDSLICAYTALLSDQEQTVAPPPGFPLSTGWLDYPIVPGK